MQRVAITATLLFFALVGSAGRSSSAGCECDPRHCIRSERPSRPALASPWSSTGLPMAAVRTGPVHYRTALYGAQRRAHRPRKRDPGLARCSPYAGCLDPPAPAWPLLRLLCLAG